MTLEQFQKEGESLLKAAKEEIEKVSDPSSLDAFKGKFLGKKSALTGYFSLRREVPKEEKKDFGKALSSLKENLTRLYEDKDGKRKQALLKKKLESEKIDITLPGYRKSSGSRHPFYLIVEEIEDFFLDLGYTVASGPEVESDRNNFELRNIPKDHPARDRQDTFVIDQNILLRSHTSAVQARVRAEHKGEGPIKIICPGKVYRRDNDATHSHQFGQIEGLVIDKDVTFSNLLETLTLLLRHLFGPKRAVRFRPSYFPFTEPSVEADISCFNCNGKGCPLCKHTGWIEILGSGMVNTNVLRLNGFDDKVYKGFAFGIGIDRIARLKYGIDDIKRFYTDDVSFVGQFRKE